MQQNRSNEINWAFIIKGAAYTVVFMFGLPAVWALLAIYPMLWYFIILCCFIYVVYYLFNKWILAKPMKKEKINENAIQGTLAGTLSVILDDIYWKCSDQGLFKTFLKISGCIIMILIILLLILHLGMDCYTFWYNYF